MRTQLRSVVFVNLCALITAIAGCQTETRRAPVGVSFVDEPAPQPAVVVRQEPHPARPRVGTGDPADPCSMRMQDLVGTLYLYYAVHKDLPNTLDDLRELADAGTELNFTCPESGKPYIYDRVGLEAPAGAVVAAGQKKGAGQLAAGTLRLILYDSVPAHSGHRWGVLAAPAGNGGQTLVTYVVSLDEKLFHEGNSAGVFRHPATLPVQPVPAIPAPAGGETPGAPQP